MRLYPDDDIWRFQGRLYEIRGWVLPFHARYVAWGLFLVGLIPGVFVAVILPGPLWFTGGIGAGVAVAIGWLAADWLAPETPLIGRLQTLQVEARTWWRYRQNKRPAAARSLNVHAIRKAPKRR